MLIFVPFSGAVLEQFQNHCCTCLLRYCPDTCWYNFRLEQKDYLVISKYLERKYLYLNIMKVFFKFFLIFLATILIRLIINLSTKRPLLLASCPAMNALIVFSSANVWKSEPVYPSRSC